MKLLYQAFEAGSFVLDLRARDLADVFHQAVNLLVARGVVAAEDRDVVEQALMEREARGSTAIGHGLAVPHAYLDAVREASVVFVRLADPLNLGAPDGIPTRFVVILLGPQSATAEHLDLLAQLARLMADDEFRYLVGIARNREEVLAALRQLVQRTAPPERRVAPAKEALKPTARLFGGIVADFRRRWRHYASDFRDGLNLRTAASVVFLLFACLAPAITFGGIMGDETDGAIGAVEMLVATSVCGVLYALVSGHPLIILGGIGPVLIFTGILKHVCDDAGLPFLPTYAWVGIWTSAILVLVAASDGCTWMQYFTRFTDEIFAALMAVLFIYESLRAIVRNFRESFARGGGDHDQAFLTLLLAWGTFYVATNLSRFRRSRYLSKWMREFLADFGPAIALLSATAVAWWLHERVPLRTLQAPQHFRTTSARPWLVDLWEGPWWSWFAAAGPAVVTAILLYLSHNITARLVNSPDHRLQKGPAYHWDLFVVGIMVGLCSVFGWPWLVAATVRSLAHVRALATTEEVVDRAGNRHERILHVAENRVSSLVVHLLMACSLLVLPWLRSIPMAVLYGLFLFMGVASLAGNQFFERLNLLLMDSSLYPMTHYVRRVPVRIIHAFTAVQAVCLAVLTAVSLAPVQWVRLTFPVLIGLLVPLRQWLNGLFAPEHLDALDAEEVPEEEETHWSG